MSCGCRFCKSVVGSWANSQLKKYYVEDFFILCPKGERGHYINENDIKACITEEEYSYYQFILLKRSLIHDEEYKICSSKECSAIGWVDKYKKCTKPLICNSCGTNWTDPYMRPLSYQIYEDVEAIYTGKMETWSYLWKELWTKLCPTCSYPIEKAGGCPHMICQNCNHEFCWTCLSDYNNHNYGKCEYRFAYRGVYYAWILVFFMLKIYYSSCVVEAILNYLTDYVCFLSLAGLVVFTVLGTMTLIFKCYAKNQRIKYISFFLLPLALICDYMAVLFLLSFHNIERVL